MSGKVISTITAKCRDCYKCLRSCPVKAIKLERDESRSGRAELHARVVEDLCILDGKCVQACPQKAKRVRSDLDKVKGMLSLGRTVVCSVAPSFAAVLPLDDPLKLPAALRRLGFRFVQETSVGAEMVGAEHARLKAQGRLPLISSSCPVVVNLIEQYYPEALPYLAPVVSPMIAHGRYLKQLFPGAKVVFIGPCIAKKDEASRPGIDDAVDVVITFEELQEWLSDPKEGVDLETLAPGEFDGIRPAWAMLFPVDGGLLKTARESTDVLAGSTATVSGLENCREVLEQYSRGRGIPEFVEMMACPGGCISGPACSPPAAAVSRRLKILEYAARRLESSLKEDGQSGGPAQVPRPELPPELLARRFLDRKRKLPPVPEEEIKRILALTGKLRPEDELNCGACGYDSCREKARAVHFGMADPGMCIPYMREKAESMANQIFASAPTGIIVVDARGYVLEMNPAARVMFQKWPPSDGKEIPLHIKQLMDPEYFTQVLESRETIQVDVDYPSYSLSTRQVIFYSEKEGVAVGLFSDITKETQQREALRKMRSETAYRAQEVINKQMQVAQKIASLLGETTAETKVLLTKLMKLISEEGTGFGASC